MPSLHLQLFSQSHQLLRLYRLQVNRLGLFGRHVASAMVTSSLLVCFSMRWLERADRADQLRSTLDSCR